MAESKKDAVIGRNIQTLRHAKGWSQAELGEALTRAGFNVQQQTVLKIEQGTRPLKIWEALVVAVVLDVPEVRLWADVGDIEREVAVTQRGALVGDAMNALRLATHRLLTARRELQEALAEHGDYLEAGRFEPKLLGPVSDPTKVVRDAVADFERSDRG